MRRPVPLASYGVLRTTDIDEARSRVGSRLVPHQLTTPDPAGFRATHNVAHLGRIGLHYIDYRSEVEIAATPLGFLLVEVPLAGTTTISAGGRHVTASPGHAAVSGWGQAHRRRFSSGNPRLMVSVEAGLVAERTSAAARAGAAPCHVSVARVDLTSGPGRTWRGLIDLVVGDIERGPDLLVAGLARASWEVAIVDGLMACLAGGTARPSPAAADADAVVKASRLIHGHCSEPLTTDDIAEAVGVSTRSLQEGFRRHLDTTPMSFLRQARLQRVRESLLDGSATTVTEAASRWGLTHLGRVSSEYRHAFGEAPSETLRGSR